jgi:hypothetical protein
MGGLAGVSGGGLWFQRRLGKNDYEWQRSSMAEIRRDGRRRNRGGDGCAPGGLRRRRDVPRALRTLVIHTSIFNNVLPLVTDSVQDGKPHDRVF